MFSQRFTGSLFAVHIRVCRQVCVSRDVECGRPGRSKQVVPVNRLRHSHSQKQNKKKRKEKKLAQMASERVGTREFFTLDSQADLTSMDSSFQRHDST